MLTADLIIDNLPASSKKQVFEALAAQAAGLFFGKPDMVLAGMIERERLGSTAIGGGAAIPHLKISGLKRMYGVLARLSAPVDYDAPDGKPVDLIFVLLVPDGGKTTLHLKALAQIARFLRDVNTCARLRNCDQAALADIVSEWLKRQAA